VQIRYTAKRSLKAGHTVDTVYTIDVNLEKEDRRFVPQVSRAVALSGNTVVTVNRRDTIYAIETVLLQDGSIPDNADMTEFLDSTVAGEGFETDITGAFDWYIIERGGYRRSRIGTTNVFKWSWSMREIAAPAAIINAAGNDE
jgi:hypothetical protein